VISLSDPPQLHQRKHISETGTNRFNKIQKGGRKGRLEKENTEEKSGRKCQ
jgi:hypothetical protein